ncbi:hypothetical protein [Roseateles violae]|uniref:Uncharacterized protein n=1 Tax=Roseateles violae TaxID=3058042 RepID=A0ABT8DUP9_9BURK|nr:hypothetical protein [Pelomonas sp. PFR6]MDN3920039.1 hypothetical protein [Pelomonas sp. PFR6]
MVEALHGFAVWIQTRRGLAEAQERNFAQALEAYLNRLGLTATGGPLRMEIACLNEGIADSHIIDLLSWLVREPIVLNVRFHPLRGGRTVVGAGQGWLHAQAGDPAVDAALLLYELRRLNASACIRVLGGYCWTSPANDQIGTALNG